MNAFVEEVAAVLQRGGKREEVFNLAKSLQERFKDQDTEEREKLGDYIGEAMRALGLDE